MIALDLCQPHYQVLLLVFLTIKSSHYLSEIYKKKCKGCEERKKIKSVCNFYWLKNNKLNYEYKECTKRWLKPVYGLIKKFPNLYEFCNGDINKFVFVVKKARLSI